jgi:hypothetical protein
MPSAWAQPRPAALWVVRQRYTCQAGVVSRGHHGGRGSSRMSVPRARQDCGDDRPAPLNPRLSRTTAQVERGRIRWGTRNGGRVAGARLVCARGRRHEARSAGSGHLAIRCGKWRWRPHGGSQPQVRRCGSLTRWDAAAGSVNSPISAASTSSEPRMASATDSARQLPDLSARNLESGTTKTPRYSMLRRHPRVGRRRDCTTVVALPGRAVRVLQWNWRGST